MMVGYRVQPGNHRAVTSWFTSEAGSEILRRLEDETEVRYVCTYLVESPEGEVEDADDFDAYDVWEAPQLAAFSRLPQSGAYAEFEDAFHPLIIDKSWKVSFLERFNG